MKIRVQLIQEVEGGYSVICPELPGCASQGETRREALRNIREAIALYLEPTPGDSEPGAEDVDLEL